ncbi:hypothetical protein ACFX2J_014743 [Malus domestica]
MAIKLLVALLCVLFSTAATQPCYPPYPQELINSMGPTLSPSSSSFPPTPTASIESNPTTPLVLALFVTGDSSVDCGTNNFLGTLPVPTASPTGETSIPTNPLGGSAMAESLSIILHSVSGFLSYQVILDRTEEWKR